MKLNADIAPQSAPGDPAGTLLQLDFDVPAMPKKRSARLDWKSPPASIKEAVARWLDEQL